MSAEPEPVESAEDEPLSLSPRAITVPRSARLRIGVGAAVMLAILGAAVAVAVGLFAPHGATTTVPDVTTTMAPAKAGAVDGAPSGVGSTSGTGSVLLYVHVLGAVERPGLYELASDARVVDAVAAAGGMTAKADPAGVNLARLLTDGEQLLVPRVGEVPPAAATSAGETGSGAAGSGANGGKVSLNSATEAELETLPQVGPALAGRILDWRKANGRFTSLEDLMNVSGIGDKTFDGFKDLITL